MESKALNMAAVAALGFERHGAVMLLVRRSDGVIVDANPAAVKFYGYPRDVLCGMPIAKINQNPPSVIRKDMDAAARAEQAHFVFPHRLATGEIRTVEVYSHTVESGSDSYLFSIIHDVSDRVRAERALAVSEEKFSRAFHASPDSITINRLSDGVYVEINEGFTRMTGYRSEDVLGRSSTSADLGIWVHDADRERMTAGVSVQGEFDLVAQFRRKDGSTLTGAMSARLVEINGERCVLTITRDITESTRAEERIRSLARFPDEDPHPVMRVTPDGALSYANKASVPLVESWVNGRREGFLRCVADAWASGTPRETDVTGGNRTWAVTVVPLDAGYVNLYGREVTKEKALVERLGQAQKMEAIGRLAGGIAHDFNNILQVIGGYCELLSVNVPVESPLRREIAEITAATRRAAALTAQLLAFSRKQVLAPKVLNVKELISSMKRMLERVIGEDIELHTVIDGATGNVWADPGQVEQVLLNLAVNARDAMPQGGKLTVEVGSRVLDDLYVREHPEASAGSFVRIDVSDTGSGMSPETLAHLYEPFFTTKELGKGTGLGLSTVFGIVKQSGGHISCYSEIGKGTTFSVYLPQTNEQPEKATMQPDRAVVRQGGETILVVEDETSVRKFTRAVLEQAGYVVVEASGGEEALFEASQHGPEISLLVTDVVMPRMGGRELARHLGEGMPSLKVLYVSGYTSNAILHRDILDAGADFMQKPFGSREFLAKVREILDRR